MSSGPGKSVSKAFIPLFDITYMLSMIIGLVWKRCLRLPRSTVFHFRRQLLVYSVVDLILVLAMVSLVDAGADEQSSEELSNPNVLSPSVFNETE